MAAHYHLPPTTSRPSISLSRICPYGSQELPRVPMPPGLPVLARSCPHNNGHRFSPVPDTSTRRSLASRGKSVSSPRQHSARRWTATPAAHLRRRRGSAERAAKINARAARATGGIRRSHGSDAPNGLCRARAERNLPTAQQQPPPPDCRPLTEQSYCGLRIDSGGGRAAPNRRNPSRVFFNREVDLRSGAGQTGGRAVAGWRRDGVEIHPGSALSCSALLLVSDLGCCVVALSSNLFHPWFWLDWISLFLVAPVIYLSVDPTGVDPSL